MQAPCAQPIAYTLTVCHLQKRDSTVFGDLLDEDEQIRNIPPPGEQDFWEGEKWEVR